MKKARDLAALKVRVREAAAEEGHASIYALHAAMQKKRVKMTYRELCRVAAGDTIGVHFETLVKLCRFLNCQVGDLFRITHHNRR